MATDDTMPRTDAELMDVLRDKEDESELAEALRKRGTSTDLHHEEPGDQSGEQERPYENEVGPTPDTMWGGSPPKAKLVYQTIKLHGPAHKQSAFVYFTDRNVVELADTFEDVLRICEMMDDASVARFRWDLAVIQSTGRLPNLLSPDAKQQWEKWERERKERQEAQEAMRRDIEERVRTLQQDSLRVQTASLSTHALVGVVIRRLMQVLDDPELNPVFEELAERSVKFFIDAEGRSGHKLIQIVLDPEDLISPDMSEHEAALEVAADELEKELEKIK